MLTFDRQGLIPAVIQDESSGQVLMVAFMNEEALRLTRATGYTHLFSRSRNTIWRKGEESGNVQEVRNIYVNCEENSLLLKVVQRGAGACHTGHHSCYYRRLLENDSYETVEERVFDPAQVYGHAAQPDEPATLSPVAGQVYEYATPLQAELPATATAVAPIALPIGEQDRQQLESDMRKLYSAYIFLRDHDLSEESNTSRLLQEQSIDYLVARLGDELQELSDVQTGAHVHTGRQDDTVLEASQVGYWLMLLATTRNIKYDEVRPHEAILRGYETPGHQTLEQAQECLTLLVSENQEEVVQGLAMGFATIGRICAEAGVSPLAPAEYDMAQMRRKGLV
jgi:phosphoribosyl-AMP cyclohydrolase/phosphoribosyl-ATP pyrophosphohydrolase